jgi:hypothetical protein
MVGFSGVRSGGQIFRTRRIGQDERKRCIKRAVETESKASVAIISGIYNASPNCIQRANYVLSPMRLVRRHTDATIKYPALDHPDIITLLLRRRRRRHISIFPNVSTLPFLPNDHVVRIGFTFARSWSVIWSRRHSSWHRRGSV